MPGLGSAAVLAPAGFEDDPQAVLQTIRRYLLTFFGCRECAEHFEEMAKESMDSVKTSDQAILWLWKKHNLVNSRLAGEQTPWWPVRARQPCPVSGWGGGGGAAALFTDSLASVPLPLPWAHSGRQLCSTISFRTSLGAVLRLQGPCFPDCSLSSHMEADR